MTIAATFAARFRCWLISHGCSAAAIATKRRRHRHHRTLMMVFLGAPRGWHHFSWRSAARVNIADKLAGAISRQPLSLASALRKIAARPSNSLRAGQNASGDGAHVHPSTRSPPGHGQPVLYPPNTENRIAELERIAREMGNPCRRSGRQPSDPGIVGKGGKVPWGKAGLHGDTTRQDRFRHSDSDWLAMCSARSYSASARRG